MKWLIVSLIFSALGAGAEPRLAAKHFVLTSGTPNRCEPEFDAEVRHARDGKISLWLGARYVFAWENIESVKSRQGPCTFTSYQKVDEEAQTLVAEDLEDCPRPELAVGARRRTLTLRGGNTIEIRTERLIKNGGGWVPDPNTPSLSCSYRAAK